MPCGTRRSRYSRFLASRMGLETLSGGLGPDYNQDQVHKTFVEMVGEEVLEISPAIVGPNVFCAVQSDAVTSPSHT